ncbi:histidinol-phosphate phosphatase family protein [Candidatus Omnitrophus magneticus]|uniref:D,D-heptose 1,7-bisphosphate phosphatase n=1 Tax=Candidatus Omnitrophus magneticus TaxID=1609969 RepID=A0A0F0CKU0_9BACT|nr:histidinol-phosphate phosphatase family protein [Candidatus Omnitrophus magneticus]
MNNITNLKQAVILAGGQGSRLRPLTNKTPKPMIPFHGKPFLLYLIEMLKEQRFEKVLLLLGYLPHVVKDYFGDGSSFGIHIDYSITDVENETARRLKLAEDKVDPVFLLMYCDNYWPMNISRMWDLFVKNNVAAQVSAYSNKDKYTKDNMRVNEHGIVSLYDKSRSAEGLQGVDIGFVIMRKEVVYPLIPQENVNFEKAVYPLLVENQQLGAYMSDHRYYSVGSHERLPLTAAFLENQPAIILDRDGVLNVKPPKARYVTMYNEFIWLPGAKDAVKLLKAHGYRVIVITNQAGISRGFMTESDLDTIHNNMKEDLAKHGAAIDAIYYCPHGWDEGCECRKPKPGMLFQAQKDFHLDITKTFFIGDDVRDKQAGDAAGCKTLLVSSQMSVLQAIKEQVLPGKLTLPLAGC